MQFFRGIVGKNQNPQFVMMPMKLRGSKLSHAAFRVFFVLRSHGDKNAAEIWPSLDTIAAEACMSRSGVQRALRELRALHVIYWDRGGQHDPNQYYFHPSATWKTDPDMSPVTTLDDDAEAARVVTFSSQSGQNRDPEWSPVTNDLDPGSRSLELDPMRKPVLQTSDDWIRGPQPEDLAARRAMLLEQARKLGGGS